RTRPGAVVHGVARTRGRPADRGGRGKPVGGTVAGRASTRLGDVADTRRGTADRPRVRGGVFAELHPSGAGCAHVHGAGIVVVAVCICAAVRWGDDTV